MCDHLDMKYIWLSKCYILGIFVKHIYLVIIKKIREHLDKEYFYITNWRTLLDHTV
jgi:hypothetical protein